MPKTPVKVYFTTLQRDMLTKIAKLEETSISEVLRNAFLEYASIRVKTYSLTKTFSEWIKQ